MVVENSTLKWNCSTFHLCCLYFNSQNWNIYFESVDIQYFCPQAREETRQPIRHMVTNRGFFPYIFRRRSLVFKSRRIDRWLYYLLHPYRSIYAESCICCIRLSLGQRKAVCNREVDGTITYIILLVHVLHCEENCFKIVAVSRF